MAMIAAQNSAEVAYSQRLKDAHNVRETALIDGRQTHRGADRPEALATEKKMNEIEATYQIDAAKAALAYANFIADGSSTQTEEQLRDQAYSAFKTAHAAAFSTYYTASADETDRYNDIVLGLDQTLQLDIIEAESDYTIAMSNAYLRIENGQRVGSAKGGPMRNELSL